MDILFINSENDKTKYICSLNNIILQMKNKSLVLLFLIFSIIFVKSQTFVLPEGFVIETVVQGLKDPTDIVIAKDGRIFITEKEGKVRIVENGVLLSTPMYTVETQTPNERGLDGIVLDPNFDVNNQFYIYYTLPTENRNKVSRVTAIGNSVVPQSELELMRFDPMWGSWHNGAGMAFDETGKLIIGIGDGTGGNNGQSLNSTLAKLIRLNTDGTIPVDNPFYTIL